MSESNPTQEKLPKPLNATTTIETGRQSYNMNISQPNMVRLSASQNHLIGNTGSAMKVQEDVDPV